MIERVHHIDFVVRDLNAAAERYAKLLDRPVPAKETLESRGVQLVRFEVGGTWIILVQPTDPSSPVHAFLERHGEGFFHIAYLVDDVVEEMRRLDREGVRASHTAPRTGVDGWRLIDLAVGDTGGVLTQLLEEAG